MKNNKFFDGLNYKQCQKRNSEKFNSLDKKTQKLLRQKGYKNICWNNITTSWYLLQESLDKVSLNFVDFAIKKAELNYEESKKNNDLLEILETGKSVVTALKMKYM
ncbi:hypothetical protein [Geminocystis sp. NIES-3709]|uniref:hypothetical protein n=1 Tax=Geminocystis sp. NIES-3709 TaxID=1617448 RepID=UPI0005FC3EBB|nr:hypothetical protein [Geminocystis sp. NIES-3709]BAQ65500.1 hypothetical protein GM3709_2265 [Geminocystis sp. NIES-3709]